MIRSELQGQHEHPSCNGYSVQIWRRGDRYLARGRYLGKQFGKTLGRATDEATAQLRRLIVQIEDGTFVPPSQERANPFKPVTARRMSIRELCNEYLKEKRSLRGETTAASYKNRLSALLEFAEQHPNRRRWPYVGDVDRVFAVEFRSYLQSRTVTRNGRPGAAEKLMSAGQIFNVLDQARSLFSWAKNPSVAKLSAGFVSPFTQEIVGNRGRKDPLRAIAFPLEMRIRLVQVMDQWQLCQFAIPLVLPLRPEDYAGLLIHEVDWERRTMRFGDRLDGHDFNKGRQSFQSPFPNEVIDIIRACVGGRTAGPLLRSRSSFTDQRQSELSTRSDVARFFDRELNRAQREIQAEQDAKRVIRRAISRLGGVTPDILSKEFKNVLGAAGVTTPHPFYGLRGSCNTEMDRSGVSAYLQKYVTGHSTSDIQFRYVSFDLHDGMRPYFDFLKPLLAAMRNRAKELGVRVVDDGETQEDRIVETRPDSV